MALPVELQISARSMSVLAEYSEQLYLDRLMALVAELSEPDEPRSEIRKRCRELVAMGRARGFQTERELAAFVTCGFAEGSDFATRPPYRTIIESPSLSNGSKAELLLLILESSEEEDEVGEEA